MKTFRMIVLAVLAAIAIGGMSVYAENVFCKDGADCESGNCQMTGEFLSKPFGGEGGAVGVCEEALAFLDTVPEKEQYEEFADKVTGVLNMSEAEQVEKVEEIEEVKALVAERIAEIRAAVEARVEAAGSD
eukprot:GHVS01062178.1.p1 GENE.GHVS01062178.1~~GHVS01062178.1.p1  ORF type:complete len:131 (+),score=21.42 GHVS01062178.1:134-526(+)